MIAAVYAKYGSPDVIAIKEVSKPLPGANEVLIKVHAATVNRTDCGFLRGMPFIVRFFSGLTKPKKTILGNEFAGQIETVGKNINLFKVGDKVFGYDGLNFGAHAGYMVMPEKGLIAMMPKGMTYEAAAPTTEGAHYALNLIKAAHVLPGQKVLVYGATGAIGSAAVQILKHFDAVVTAVCGTNSVALVKSLGAGKVVDYMTQDFTKLDTKFDVIIDAVGKSSFGACKPLLKPHGIYMSTELGNYAQNPFLALITPLFGGKKVLFPIPKDKKEDVLFFKGLIEAGKFKPVIDRSFRLENIVEAYEYVETGQKTGNIVITFDH